MKKIIYMSFLIPALDFAAGTDDIVDSITGMDKFKLNEYDESIEVPWVEIETSVKKLPDDGNLVQLPIDKLAANNPPLELFVDVKNILLSDKDHVARSWFVVRSEQGAYNGTYEGIRCATGEYKVYAYANPARSKPLRVVKIPKWRKARKGSYREEMMRDYFCDYTSPKSQEALSRLEYIEIDYLKRLRGSY